MNIAIILAGGCGKRFGKPIPKQYNKINRKAVIDYVVGAAKKAKTIDKIIVVMDKRFVTYVKELTENIAIVQNGEERMISLNNALQYIDENYNECDNVIILDGVAPLIKPNIIDNYIKYLSDYDVVVTAKKITGELANYSLERLKRDDYCIIHSPEAYKFKLLKKYFNPKSEYTEVAYQLPKNIKLYFDFEFDYNVKITYNYDLIC